MRDLIDQIAWRAVRAGFGGRLGERRTLLRGLGMGGTASTMIWNIGYDPVFTTVESVTGALAPSYVDYGEALLWPAPGRCGIGRADHRWALCRAPG